jgi:uncharacterized protein (TIGR02646 family)
MYINFNNLTEPKKKWLDKASELLSELENSNNIEERNKLIDKNHRFWKLFKDSFKELSHGKCWYSETKNPYSHLHIDHFRPKKRVEDIFDKANPIRDGYWWLTYDYKNYRLCGSVGNTKKGDHFAVKYNKVGNPAPICDEVYYFLDPTVKDDVKLLNFDNNGDVKPAAPESFEKWNFDRAKYTIDYLDLNYSDLKEIRKLKWQEATEIIKNVSKLNAVFNQEPTNQNKYNKDAEIEKLRKMLSPDQDLTSTVRSCLRASGQDWAYKLLEE